LLKEIISFEVWFGCKLYWLNKLLDTNRNTQNPENNNKYSLETDTKAEEYTLTVLEQEIYKNNTKVAIQIVKKAGTKAWVFQKDWLVIQAISSKIQKSTEIKYLLCCIVKVVKNQYLLITAKGPLSRSYSALQLNPVEASDQSLVFYNWPATTKKLFLTKAVQLANNCSIIAAAQKAARLIDMLAIKKQQQNRKYKELEPEPELEYIVLYISTCKKKKRMFE
jgi:hypothetical protein